MIIRRKDDGDTRASTGRFSTHSRCGQTARNRERNVKLPWPEPSSRFTALFERLAIDWMMAASQKAVGDQLQLSWDEVHAIQERAVVRGLARRAAEPSRVWA